MTSSPDFSRRPCTFVAGSGPGDVNARHQLVSVQLADLPLQLLHPFALAHGVTTCRQNVLVQIASGWGEAACVPYRGETPELIASYVLSLDWQSLGWSEVEQPLHLAHVIAALPPGPAAARAAIDMALHDIWAQSLGRPLYECLGLNPHRIAPTSQTVAQAQPPLMAERARQMRGSRLKIKLGGHPGLDEQRLIAVSDATEATIRADANGGWSLEQALIMLPRLAERGVELIEQPLAVGDFAGLRVLSRLSSRPAIYVDESIETAADIVAHAGLVEGVVVKLAKAGGIAGACQQIAVARSLGMRVMLSCMVESSVAVTAAAHIAPLVDEVDLDGPLLIRDEPFQGVEFEGDRLSLTRDPGLGLSRRMA